MPVERPWWLPESGPMYNWSNGREGWEPSNIFGDMRMPQRQPSEWESQRHEPWMMNQSPAPEQAYMPGGWAAPSPSMMPHMSQIQGYAPQMMPPQMPAGYDRMIQGYGPREVEQMQQYNNPMRPRNMGGYLPMSVFDQHVGG